MTRLHALAVAACSIVFSASCNLLDLSARINQAPCATLSECAVLNDPTVEPTFRRCQPFVCSERHFCESVQLDNDHDGFSPKECASEPSKADCNDFEPNIHPGATEVCDELDNDCDQHIDEGSLPVEQTVVVNFDGRIPVSDLSAANDDSRVALGYIIDATSPQLAANVIAYQDISQQDVMPLHLGSAPDPVRAVNTSVALLRGPVLLVGAYVTADPARLVVANVQRGSMLTANRITQFGLSCAEGEACAANSSGSQDIATVATGASSSPALAPGADGVLVAYVRDSGPGSDTCKPNRTPATRQILANLVVSAGFNTSERTKMAVAVGDTAQNSAPAVIAVPGSTTNGRPYGWLLAYPNASGELVLAQVSLDGGNIRVSEALLTLSSANGPLHSPRFAEGIRSQEHVAFGMVAVQGCGDESKVIMAVIDVTLGSLGGVALRIENKLTPVGTGKRDRTPALAFHAKRRSWGVAYRDAAGVRARIVDPSGVATGTEPYVLLEGGSEQPAQSVAIATLNGGWFSVLAFDGADGGGIVKSDLVGCAGR